MKSLKIRQAEEADSDAILRCLAVAFAPYKEQYTPAAFADTVLNDSTLQARLQTMHVLVAILDGEIVGTVAGAHDGEEGHLRGMAVLPQFRGAGVAAQLLDAIEDWLRTQGCTHVSLDTTLPLQPAMKFYEKHGYLRSGCITDFFGMPLIEYVKMLG
jgi:ribosomal protein S18 acetylase RimI-like enzyme